MVRTTTWDRATGSVTVPPRTVAVLVEKAAALQSLVEKSIVVRSEVPDGSWYRMAEAIRAYSLDRVPTAALSRGIAGVAGALYVPNTKRATLASIKAVISGFSALNDTRA